MTWSQYQLRDLADSIDYGVSESAVDRPVGPKFLRITDIQDDQVNWNSVPYCKSSEQKLRAARLRKGDIVFARTGATTGKSFLIRECPDNAIFASYLIRVRAAPSVEPAFLAHFFRSETYWQQISATAVGAAQPGINATKLGQLKIPLPPLAEQKRIAVILDQADKLLRKRQRALVRLNQLGQAIFIEMFGDPKSNPKGWKTARLGDLCDVGSSKRVFVEEFVERGVPFYRGTEVGKLAAGENIEPDLFIAPEHYDSLISQSGKPAMGDLLLPSICHDGRIWKVDSPKPFYFKDGRVLWIKAHQAEIESEYLRRYLQNRFLFDYASIASGTTFAELKIVNLKSLAVLNPPRELQVKFSSRISTIEALQQGENQAHSHVSSLFASLQHRAFRGEL
ncbi:hypothetical protein HB662_27955 [Roseomonas frigidaquae]|uniref:Type I restriction modification DNA specificity domain-containing protein n=1 Tax=Falsiroseomonas frigidaquae TaxID=487318 RepID=A0ABX1F8B6_9PROT|nr:restriction endonuclease subunit S [Falsiroseomonas frigidaquae]NKE48633.1 hypothetical protein [Falsiroseomonas frigidaquae]